jgi:hypothetical protein
VKLTPTRTLHVDEPTMALADGTLACMNFMAIDPGTAESAYVVFHAGHPNYWRTVPNVEMLRVCHDYTGVAVVCEMVACYGQPVGAEVFETCLWIGRFWEAWGDRDFYRVVRNDVKKHLCHKIVGINDSVIRQALIDRFGPGKDKAIGKKKEPGPLYGMSGDEWAALALAVTFADKMRADRPLLNPAK